MKIPQYIRQEPARVIPGVRVNPAAMTQDLQAMGQFGETLSKVGSEFGTKMREAREVSEYSNAENLWKEGINQNKLNLDKDTDYKTFLERFEKTQGDLYNQVASGITEPNAKAAFKRFVDKNLVSERYEIGRKASQIEIGFMEADYYKQIELAVKRGDIDFINKSTNAAISAGYLKADVGEKARENAIKSVNEQVVWTIANSLGFEEGMKFLNDPEKTEDISVSKLNSMKASLRTQWNTQNKIDDRQLKETQDKTSADYFTQLDKGTLTLDMVNRAVLAQTLSEADGRYYKKALEQETAGKTNPDTHLKLKDEILTANTEEKRIKAREKVLKAYGENKLFYKDAGTLLARIKEVDPIQNDRARRFHADLKQKNKDGVFESDVFLEKSNTLDAWLKANPDAKDKEVEDFFKALTKEEDNGWVAKILDAFWGVATFGAPNIEFPEKGGDDEAIRILIENKQPVTPANIKYIKDNM